MVHMSRGDYVEVESVRYTTPITTTLLLASFLRNTNTCLSMLVSMPLARTLLGRGSELMIEEAAQLTTTSLIAES